MMVVPMEWGAFRFMSCIGSIAAAATECVGGGGRGGRVNEREQRGTCAYFPREEEEEEGENLLAP